MFDLVRGPRHEVIWLNVTVQHLNPERGGDAYAKKRLHKRHNTLGSQRAD
jgi:hypothetical protein